MTTKTTFTRPDFNGERFATVNGKQIRIKPEYPYTTAAYAPPSPYCYMIYVDGKYVGREHFLKNARARAVKAAEEL